MKHNRSAWLASALVGLALTAPAFAQAPGGGPGGGGFGGQRRPPFTFGAVSAVDATAGTITITPQFGGNGPQTIKVGADAQIVSQTTVTLADLKVGDQISVQGIPTGITASQITAGQPPAGLPGAGGFGGPRGGNGGGGNAAGSNAGQSFATASGTIKTLPTANDPHLSITLGPDVQIFLKIAEGAKITKYTTVTLAGIKAGDQVMATGQTGDDGTLTASAVGVNLPMNMGGFGRGGGRNRHGGGGFGGGNPFGGGPVAPPPPAQDNGATPQPPVQ